MEEWVLLLTADCCCRRHCCCPAPPLQPQPLPSLLPMQYIMLCLAIGFVYFQVRGLNQKRIQGQQASCGSSCG